MQLRAPTASCCPALAHSLIAAADSTKFREWSTLSNRVRKSGKPFFGICVGMQLMAERGREYQVTPGLGWIAGEVDRIAPSDPDLKIPHMGWNTLNVLKAHPLPKDIQVGPDGLHAYFVHSYELKAAKQNDLIAQADYGGP